MQKNNNEDFSQPLKDALAQSNAPVFPSLDEVYTKLKLASRAKRQHTPYQEGVWLVCKSCQQKHSLSYLGPLKSFRGFDEKGEMIIVDRKFE